MTKATKIYNAALTIFRINVPGNEHFGIPECIEHVEEWMRFASISYPERSVAVQVGRAYDAYVYEINNSEEV